MLQIETGIKIFQEKFHTNFKEFKLINRYLKQLDRYLIDLEDFRN